LTEFLDIIQAVAAVATAAHLLLSKDLEAAEITLAVVATAVVPDQEEDCLALEL
jgi:hypothetical protein